MITQWKDDINQGLITKGEIYESLPDCLQGWIEGKLKNVIYDENGEATSMFMKRHRQSDG